jgi:hypothetical protein
LSQFLSETLKPLEQSFLSALEIQDKGHNELSDTVTIIHINQQTILNKLNSISCKEKQDPEKSDVENSTKYKEIVKIKDDLYKQTQVLQESLQKTRHECSLKEAELYHKLRTEKNKTIQIQQTNNELLKSLEHQIEIKQQVINSTNTSLDDIKLQCKSLEKILNLLRVKSSH